MPRKATATSTVRRARKATARKPRARKATAVEVCRDCGASYADFRSGESADDVAGWIWASEGGMECDAGGRTEDRRNVQSEIKGCHRAIKRASWDAAHGPGRCCAELPAAHGWYLTAADREANLAALDLDDAADVWPGEDLREPDLDDGYQADDDGADLDASFDPGAWGDAPEVEPDPADDGADAGQDVAPCEAAPAVVAVDAPCQARSMAGPVPLPGPLAPGCSLTPEAGSAATSAGTPPVPKSGAGFSVRPEIEPEQRARGVPRMVTYAPAHRQRPARPDRGAPRRAAAPHERRDRPQADLRAAHRGRGHRAAGQGAGDARGRPGRARPPSRGAWRDPGRTRGGAAEVTPP